jgi:hypothetical protein
MDSRSKPDLRALTVQLRRVVVSFGALAIAGCGADARRASTFAVRDSAGIEIVESAEPLWQDGEGWRLSEEPVFDARGAWLGVVTTPARFGVSEIGDDYMAGVWRDADDIEHARVYELRK